jgi:hypothetical protein
VPADIVKGAILVSGMYHLAPVQQTRPDEWLLLSVAGAAHVERLRQQRDIQRLGHFGGRRARQLRRRRGVEFAEFARRGSAGQAGTPDDQRLAQAVLSEFNDFKVCLGHAAVRAGPAGRYIGPDRAGSNAVFRAAGGLVVHKTADDADISFHENLSVTIEEARFVCS